jgi:molybdenum cofactor synthesis domain-containing protein
MLEMTTGTVASVNISREKGTCKEPVSEIVVGTLGIESDAHAGNTHRQISLLALESIERFGAESNRAFKYGEFAENITTSGIDLNTVALLDRFKIGGVELEVTQIGKKCHGDGCAIFREVGQCVMPREGIFCRVITGGTVCPGYSITHIPRPLRIKVITLSDRAHGGVYEDRSGPQITTHLNDFFANRRWHLQIANTLIPDDRNLFTKELNDARNDGIDVVFSTGGTGVGPRDIAPDIALALADKVIPGIMEHIRVKYGAEKPNALLSRSTAITMDRMLVYVIPGSVKAVNEYMPELVKTLEHLICTLHGLDTH